MNKLTAEKIAAEMDAFEKLYPIPRYTSRCGNGYTVSEFNAWDGHEYCNMWKGWIARAEIALPVLAPQTTTDTCQKIENDGWIKWCGGDCPVHTSKRVHVKFATGDEDIGRAEFFVWDSVKSSYGVIAYRVIEND